jgi:hypothetical protein
MASEAFNPQISFESGSWFVPFSRNELADAPNWPQIDKIIDHANRELQNDSHADKEACAFMLARQEAFAIAFTWLDTNAGCMQMAQERAQLHCYLRSDRGIHLSVEEYDRIVDRLDIIDEYVKGFDNSTWDIDDLFDDEEQARKRNPAYLKIEHKIERLFDNIDEWTL